MNKKLFLVYTIENIHEAFAIISIIFGILFFYEITNHNIFLTVLPYGLAHLYYAVFVTFSSWIAGKLGVRNTLIIALILFALTPIPILLYNQTHNYLYPVLWIAIYFTGKLFYHPNIIYSISKYTEYSRRGKQLSYLTLALITTSTITPMFAGVLSVEHGFVGLSLASVAIVSLAIIPVLMLENERFDLEINFRKWYKNSRIRDLSRLTFMIELQRGGNKIWPIWVFIALGSSMSEFGFAIGITTAISMCSIWMLGRFIDQHNRLKTVKYIALFYGIGWLVRAFSHGVGFVVGADILGRFGHLLTNNAMEVVTYDAMTDGVKPQNFGEMVIVREIGIDAAIGVATIIVGALGQFVGLPIALLFCAVASLFTFITPFPHLRDRQWGRWLNFVRNFISSANPSTSNFNFVS